MMDARTLLYGTVSAAIATPVGGVADRLADANGFGSLPTRWAVGLIVGLGTYRLLRFLLNDTTPVGAGPAGGPPPSSPAGTGSPAEDSEAGPGEH